MSIFSSTAYINGNYMVISRSYFTKERVFRCFRKGEDFKPDFPDSIDIKITNKCKHNCKYCHESSIVNGNHFNLFKTLDILKELKGIPIELAIGGGNIFECPDTEEFIKIVSNEYLFFPRITVNSKDINEDTCKLINKWYNLSNSRLSLGISIENERDAEIIYNSLDNKIIDMNIVFHLIIGIFPEDKLISLLSKASSLDIDLLILGYKSWGRGIDYQKNNNIDFDKWKDVIRKIFYLSRIGEIPKLSNDLSITLDNLAIEQLNIKDILLESEWNDYYSGEEFTRTMYIDAVEEKFAPTSRDPMRISWNDISLINFFKKYKK